MKAVVGVVTGACGSTWSGGQKPVLSIVRYAGTDPPEVANTGLKGERACTQQTPGLYPTAILASRAIVRQSRTETISHCRGVLYRDIHTDISLTFGLLGDTSGFTRVRIIYCHGPRLGLSAEM